MRDGAGYVWGDGVMAKGVGSVAKQSIASGKNYSMGVTWKVGVTNPQYAQVGNLDPAQVRAINIKKANAILQEKWANEWLQAVKQLESSRAAIEKIRADIEKLHFKTEQEIDEYILGALLAKEEYDAHFREWTARKNEATKYINGGADEEIRVVAAAFADRIRLRKTKSDQKIKNFTEKTNAEIAEVGKNRDNTNAVAAAQEKARMKAFMRGDDMDLVEAIGGSNQKALGGGSSGNSVGLLDSLGNLFVFK